MYVYINSESSLYTVGFYSPDGKWQPESDHNSSEEAANRVAYLNGSSISETNPYLLSGSELADTEQKRIAGN